MHAYIHTYIYTYTHTRDASGVFWDNKSAHMARVVVSMFPYIQTNKHTYIHTYIHTYTYTWCLRRVLRRQISTHGPVGRFDVSISHRWVCLSEILQQLQEALHSKNGLFRCVCTYACVCVCVCDYVGIALDECLYATYVCVYVYVCVCVCVCVQAFN
jgi:hypothetical protein